MLELLLVIAIILVLTTMYWGGTSGNRERRAQAACQQNLEKISMAMEIYAHDHAGKYPVVSNARTSGEALSVLVPRYTVDTSVFICPGSKDSPLPESEPFKQHPISYAYYMGRAATDPQPLMSDKQVDTLAKAPGQNVFSGDGKPPGNNHGKHGGNFLFCDGHIEQSGVNARSALPLAGNVMLLNPEPGPGSAPALSQTQNQK